MYSGILYTSFVLAIFVCEFDIFANKMFKNQLPGD